MFCWLEMAAPVRIDPSGTLRSPRLRPLQFCSRCGRSRSEPPGRVEAQRRVCQKCGLGMLLSCHPDALPVGSGAGAFVILDRDLVVRAVSDRGERYFGSQDELLGRHVFGVVTSPLGNEQLERGAARAADREGEPLVLPVRLLSDDAGSVGTLTARIATCGPPRAALLAVEPSGFGRG